ncbi:hypothetical protein HDU77_010277, partial [Chytriomyces hyalinus]
MRRQYGGNANTDLAKTTGAGPGKNNPNPTGHTSKHAQQKQHRTDPARASLQTLPKSFERTSRPPKKVFPVVFYKYTNWTVDFDASRRATNMASCLFSQGEEQFAIVMFDGDFSEATLGKYARTLEGGINQWRFLTFTKHQEEKRGCVMCRATRLNAIRDMLGLTAVS